MGDKAYCVILSYLAIFQLVTFILMFRTVDSFGHSDRSPRYGEWCSALERCEHQGILMLCIGPGHSGLCRCNTRWGAMLEKETNQCVIRPGLDCSGNLPCSQGHTCEKIPPPPSLPPSSLGLMFGVMMDGGSKCVPTPETPATPATTTIKTTTQNLPEKRVSCSDNLPCPKGHICEQIPPPSVPPPIGIIEWEMIMEYRKYECVPIPARTTIIETTTQKLPATTTTTKTTTQKPPARTTTIKTTTQTPPPAKQASYGEPCNAQVRCTHSEFIMGCYLPRGITEGGICACNPRQAFYEKETNRCVIKPGGFCYSEADSGQLPCPKGFICEMRDSNEFVTGPIQNDRCFKIDDLPKNDKKSTTSTIKKYTR